VVQYRNELLRLTSAEITEVDLAYLAGENFRASLPAQNVLFEF